MDGWATLRAAWNGVTQPPAGVTGTALTAQMTTQQKLDAVNAWTIDGPLPSPLVTPSQILNAIVPADLASLTTAQVALLTLLLQGSTVDASNGTIRTAVKAIFSGKTQTLQNLAALVAPLDVPTRVSWLAANGYASKLGLGDIEGAGLS